MSAPSWVDDPLLARVAWSRVVEATDRVGARMAHALGPGPVLEAVLAGRDLPVEVLSESGTQPRHAARLLSEASERWRLRGRQVDPDADLAAVSEIGGRVLVPDDPEWPRGLDDLGEAAPLLLWVRGHAPESAFAQRSVALVGSRASTHYGERVAHELAQGCAERELAVVSGAAFGIDAAAHVGALAARGSTVAVVACGVDVAYPRAHAALLEQIVEAGVVLSESAPGARPTRWRFLERNRLIAALSDATVVVEAAWRSGALSTARHAVSLARPVGAVPGPVTSPASAGCHRLLRESGAVCITDAAEVVELASTIGTYYPPTPATPAGPLDGVEGPDRQVLDAASPRSWASAARLALDAGVSQAQAEAACGRLLAQGRLERDLDDLGCSVWRRAARREVDR